MTPLFPCTRSLRLGNLEELLEALNDSLNIEIDEGHLVVGILLHDGDEGEVLVDLAQDDGTAAVGGEGRLRARSVRGADKGRVRVTHQSCRPRGCLVMLRVAL